MSAALNETPVVTVPHEELSQTDFAAFRALNDLPMGMSAHIRFDALDSAPATSSNRMIGIIRDEIGFDGLLMTDDISMNGLTGTIGERSAASIAAGIDLILHCHGHMNEMEEVVANAGEMTPEAKRRADHALTFRREPEAALTADLLAEYRALGGQVEWPTA